MFRIGDFSRLARVTIRTLHHYDETGLLQPAHVDEQTGYRYYTAAQLEVLQRIVLLKDLGFPLDEIREVLGTPPNAPGFVQVLDARRAQLIETISGDQSRLRRLEALRVSVAGAVSADVPAVALRHTPAIEAYTIRARVPRLGVPVQALFETAEAAVARVRARAEASPFMIFHDLEYREEDADIEVCIPVKGAASARIGSRVIPASPSMGCVTYRGPYDQAPGLYNVMLLWMERSGMRIDGPLREVYHRYGADQIGYRVPAHVRAACSAEYVTELQAPVAPLA
jgi:DNA-binding transcriptional MerR regulator/effector-binding domain-containing protein